MSSYLRTIARTVKLTENGELKSRRSHFNGRGSKLGVTNPKDPCRTGKTKAPKPWRNKANAPKAKAKLVPATVDMGRTKPCNRPWKGFDRENLAVVHRMKMQRKAERNAGFAQSGSEPGRVSRLLGIPAGINRHTGRPHEHKREIARRACAQ